MPNIPAVYIKMLSGILNLTPTANRELIDDTNQEGRTSSGINTSVGPDLSTETEGLHEGLALHEC